MLLGLLAALLFAPLYWAAVPARWRRDVLSVASLIVLGLVDARLPPFLIAFGLLQLLAMRAAARSQARGRTVVAVAGLTLLLSLFLWNKLAGHGLTVLSSQTGLVLLGVSYLVLKAAGALIEAARGAIGAAGFRDVLAWIVFLPTYPSGPMETLDHFRGQWPAWDRARVLGGLERILFGLVKALVLGFHLGEWAAPMLEAPGDYGAAMLLAGLYAQSLRFYLDFSGYSDVAIGLAAVFGYDIEENFDRPFLRRNLVLLWQNWHITLTRWLRTYLFIPVSRAIMRRSSRRADRAAIAAGQIVAMTFCGLWHGVAWNFALWGFLHALGLVWVGVVSRDLGRSLPTGLVTWWRRSRIAEALAVILTFNYFSLLVVFVVTDAGTALAYLGHLFGR